MTKKERKEVDQKTKKMDLEYRERMPKNEKRGKGKGTEGVCQQLAAALGIKARDCLWSRSELLG